eukprot:gene18056-biopygen11895
MSGNTFHGCPPDIERPEKAAPRRQGCPPPDEDIVIRRNYYALLSDQFGAVAEHRTEDGRIVVWVDGGCSKGRAGAGIYYGQGNGRNCACAVEGEQTSARAEVTAMLHALATDGRRLLIVTDNMYVCNGVREGRLHWRCRAWFRSPLNTVEIPHADLWRQIDSIVDRRDPTDIEVRWCKSHALPKHVHAGLTTELHVFGNNMADELATRAIAMASAGGPSHLSVPLPSLDLSDPAMQRAAALSAAAEAFAAQQRGDCQPSES